MEVQFQEKPDFWWRFLAEIFVYLGQYQPENDWQIVALFANRKLNPGLPNSYQILAEKIKLLYLDELEISPSSSIGLEIISLIVGSDNQAISTAQKAVSKSRETLDNTAKQKKVIELIETVLVYKLKNLTREEVEAMFTLDDLKETRYFQDVRKEAKLEGKLETIPLLIELGMTAEDIAKRLDLSVEIVKKVAIAVLK